MIPSKTKRNIPLSATTKMAELASERCSLGLPLHDLSKGEVSINLPQSVIEKFHRELPNLPHGYGPIGGIPEVKYALQNALNACSPPFLANDQPLVTTGAKEALWLAILATVDSQAYVGIPVPYWVSYPEMVRLAGGKIIFLTPEPGEKFPFSALEMSDPRPDVLILNSPSNPSGVVLDAEDMKRLLEWRVKGNAILLFDRVYSSFDYTGMFVDPIHISGCTNKIVCVDGLSKSYGLAGWRIGYSWGDEEVLCSMRGIMSHTTTHPTIASQWLAKRAIEGRFEFPGKLLNEFKEKRDMVVDSLQKLPGVKELSKPQGAFYVFWDYRQVLESTKKYPSDISSKALAENLLKESGVAVVPGVAFGSEGHLRLSYAAEKEQVKSSIEALNFFFSGI